MKTLIHPTAVIHPNAELHSTVQVGAYAVIGANVQVGPETVIGAHAVVEGPCKIGAGNHIFPGAVIGMEPQDLKYVGELSWVKIGDNNAIREYVTINRATGHGEATVIGNGNLLMAYVHVGHNCIIEDSVIIANSVALAGHVHIESRARLSGVLGVHQFVHIGGMSMIGGMTRIDRDVPPYMLVEGNPSRIRSLNLVGLKRSGMPTNEFQLLKKAFRILYCSNVLFKDALSELELLGDTSQLKHLRRFLLLSQMPGRRGLIPGKSPTKGSDNNEL
ncbi:acyl-[acyl-carrier-protein]--UDP-N-acetylglucosamine O-acyltransferase [Cylindrospermopsis raciborskii CENA303]|uniref:Acyl-[acyl-carrier-protein]--UDP-N-acetylglucosamine O-acyltransferase n=1 Tax=Cylindrospermopsis raciborskii CENA303 TaxID=1170769 RepID=A0A1X4GB23_9CYAN|nr:acyl-ACP--UDP-N-acetylglucosamine O-acyltransferase [Cylindrospermopsis raciborskii]OSO94368.1 acyl-[acyl-carrier-protein]--UDP-N-acetylglucosamine O-acyltransferase [Cylindrospermopsis raciborskii CENA303]